VAETESPGSEPTVVHLVGLSVTGTSTTSMSLRRRYHMSGQHFRSSAYFARQSYQIEQSGSSLSADDRDMQYMAYVTASLLANVAGLEALINEYFADVVATHLENIKQLSDDTREFLRSMWNWNFEKVGGIPTQPGVLAKYRKALSLANKAAFEESKPPIEQVQQVIEIRDKLVHYQAQFDTDSGTISQHFETAFGATTFPLNPFSPQGTFYFPQRMLSHGCAEWAFQSSDKFVDAFCQRIGYRKPYGESPIDLPTR